MPAGGSDCSCCGCVNLSDYAKCLVVAYVLLASALVVPPARGDAIVVSRAMQASTIAEYFVEKDRLRVRIEVGGADLDAFRNRVEPFEIGPLLAFGSLRQIRDVVNGGQRYPEDVTEDASVGSMFSYDRDTRWSNSLQHMYEHVICNPTYAVRELSFPASPAGQAQPFRN